MKKRLKTWEVFEEEFRPLADRWDYIAVGDLYIDYKNMKWVINSKMKKLFGTEIEVEEMDKYFRNKNYTYQNFSWLWHELWFESEFEPIEFITKEEFSV